MPKRLLVAVVTLPLLVAVTATASPIVSPVNGPCDLARRSSESTQHFMRRRISCAVKRFGPVGGGTPRAICIAKRESGLDPSAESATGDYLGLYQHSATLWSVLLNIWSDE
ncbi:MAG: hypothetical protein M3O29_06080, partial [Actinomycetota bacterium]|nr:hypothetical protein [Actinomycetota bacterium]